MDESVGSEFGVKRVQVHRVDLGGVVVIQISKEVREALRNSDDATLKAYKGKAPSVALEHLANQYWQRIGHPVMAERR